METSAMLKALQDPMGIPFYPVVFQVLMVLTFSLHIIFVNFTLGTSFLAIYGHIKKEGHWMRLSRAMAKSVPVHVSMAMLLGVAPLLFVQVIYDPFWYASNTLSAAWVMGFILIMMIGYSFTYIFYLGRQKRERGYLFFGITAFALFLLSGVIMHVLGYQLLQPEKWLSWYTKGNAIDTSGTSLHAFQLPRFLHFIIPSFAMTGIFLMLYAWYFKDRHDMDRAYLDWVGNTGGKLALIFTVIQALVGFWWLLSLPMEFSFFTNPFFLIAVILGIALLALLYTAQQNPVRFAIPSAIVAFITIFAMSYTREALRMTYLDRFDYSIFNYKMSMDMESTALFLATFVMGLVIIGYFLSIAYKSGKVVGEYVATPDMNRWGRISIGLLVAWIVVVAGLGIVISIRNYL